MHLKSLCLIQANLLSPQLNTEFAQEIFPMFTVFFLKDAVTVCDVPLVQTVSVVWAALIAAKLARYVFKATQEHPQLVCT